MKLKGSLAGFGRPLLFAAVLLGGVASCADLPERIRAHTYPPDFRYIEPSRVRSAMWELAQQTRDLDRILHDSRADSPERQRAVVAVLRTMNDAASSIDPSGRKTNHALIDENLDLFRHDLALALRLAEAQPPNYFLAGFIAGTCLSCHSGGS
ncbi:MAG: hypothetical protein HY270_10165 [Deltaproteobacteria bacterium]|nr:hypothetical protein [Deltaproteobacteria bacterium]